MRVLTGIMLWGLAEIAAFVVLGRWIGVLGVLTIVLGTGVLGVALLRRQGRQAVSQMRGGVVQLRPEMLGASGLAALGGVLLVLPGVLADVAGVMLLVPAVQRWIGRLIGARFTPEPEADILDGVAVEVEAPRLPGGGASRPRSGWTQP